MATTAQKYDVNQHLIETLLTWVRSGEIAIPEIQRPFVWKASKVRDLLDSLYKGYPVGYLIAWKNPDVRLKDGSVSEGRRILIDGQQRVTALTAALLGQPVVNKRYRPVRVRVAFHPVEERFEVLNPAIRKDADWIPDVAALFRDDTDLFEFVGAYCEASGRGVAEVSKPIQRLLSVPKRQIGMIELAPDLDIETVTEIFIRINSKGVVLSQADFAMSKIAAAEAYGGPHLRKAVDYFCHLAVEPSAVEMIQKADPEFAATDDWRRMLWLRNENDDLYDPSYTDVLRVAFTSEFGRGKLSDLVALLSGRNFETRTFEAEIAEDSFRRLGDGVAAFINETHFKRLLMILRSAGYVTSRLIRSQNALNFAYILYLRLRKLGVEPAQIERLVRRWFVLNVLTGRFSGAAETALERDVGLVTDDVEASFARLEEGELSDAFWDVVLPDALSTSSASNPQFLAFIAAQVKAGDLGFLSRDITVADLVTHKFDLHHVFPRALLRRRGLSRSRYNQVANYVVTQSEINVRISDQPPDVYFGRLLDQVRGGALQIGGIDSETDLRANLAAHAIPEAALEMTAEDYPDFLDARRRLMAAKMRRYYEGL